MLVTSTPAVHPDESRLLFLLAGDSEAAFTRLYDQYHHRVYHVALRYLKCEAQAEEVVQEVFLKLWLKRREIKVDAPVEAWLFTVAKNNTLNRLKKIAIENKAKAYLKYTLKQEEDTAQDRLRNSDSNRLLQQALQSLSENQLKVYRLAREENFSHLQIAAQLNISKLTVKTHMARALQHLKEFFHQQ